MTRGRDRSKMIYAFFRFNPKNSGVTTSRAYERFVAQFKLKLTGELNQFYGKKHTSKSKAKISANHGMRGRSCYDVWLERYGPAEADRRRAVMLARRSKSLSGEHNPMFGKVKTAAQRRAHASRMTGPGNPNWGKTWVWIVKHGSTKRVLAKALNQYLKAGWSRGRT